MPLGCRGATSVLIAGTATVLLGFAGLAVEAGSWYLSLRNATTAADLAALAGAAARERGDNYVTVARDTAALNGFPNASEVTVQPPASGNFTGDSTAVEVIIARTQSMSLARLFLNTPPTVRSRAVAVTHADENVCVLALQGGLVLGGNSTTYGQRCDLAANAPSPGGISVSGNARVRTVGLLTTGTCNGCSGGDVWTDDTRTVRPLVVANRPDPITDPFAGLQNWTPGPLPGCLDLSKTSPTMTALSKGSATISQGQAICTSLTIGPQQTLNLNPGLYYFNNADLAVQGKITGNGVTLVFTGDPDRVGTIQINSQATGSLRGPTGSLITNHPEAAGLIMYRDARATDNGSAKQVQINGSANMDLFGSLYFPTSDVVVNGTSNSNCLAIVGYYLSFSGSAATQVDVSGCKGFTAYPTQRAVRLVE